MTEIMNCDVLIVGAGAAGLTAAIYTVRYNLNTVVISTDFGGQILETGEIENWPGTKKIMGRELSLAFEEHAKSLGANLLNGTVKSIKPEEEGFWVETDASGNEKIFAKAIILCAGAKHRKLGIVGEKELAGRGISYCATCDAPFFRGKAVAMVGGGDAAITGAIDISCHASKVYIIHRREDFRAKPAYIDMAKNNPKIEFVLGTNVVEARGEGRLEKIILDKAYKGSTELSVDGLFIEIGFLPETSLVLDLGIKFDDQGYIDVANNQATNIPGVFAAGDVTNGSNRFAQLVTAASEGAIAAEAVYRYIQGTGLPNKG